MSRRARQINDLKRSHPKRAAYDRVLIVCEGSKTEPNYFRELVDHLKLNSANVEVDGESDSSPRSVVTHAIKRYQSDDEFDQVYCVFDRDEHATFHEALQRIRESKRIPLNAIVSVPCFEYWLLLHYEFTTKPYARSGDRSAADCVIVDLKKHLPSYNKGDKKTFQQLKGKLQDAIEHAQRILKHCESNQTNNPSTQTHLLVEYLYRLKG